MDLNPIVNKLLQSLMLNHYDVEIVIQTYNMS